MESEHYLLNDLDSPTNVQIVHVKDHVGYYIVDDDGNRTWYADNDTGNKPLKGCEFVSIDQAYAFYKDYRKRAGFDVRNGHHYKPKPGENPNLKWFLCSKEVKQTRNQGSGRCGCLAKIRINKFEENLYRVYTFIKGNKHHLVSEKDMIYMKSLRDLGYTNQHFLFQASNANFGPSTGFRLLKQMCGGFDRVGATVVDCDDDKLVGLFWADEQAIRDYAVFGDIGLLEEFKNAFGKDLNVVITDQDPSMKFAIPECFSNTRHRLCMWHIMQKLVTKIMSDRLEPRRKPPNPKKIYKFLGRVKGLKVFVGNFTYECDFVVLEDATSIIDP
nr:hypothetical protein [Tanacetum cinerariifolium]